MTSELLRGTSDPGTDFAFRAVPELQSALLEIVKSITVPAGEVIFKQGAAAKGIYLLMEGKARLSMLDVRGEEIPAGARSVGTGCILGLPAVLCSITHVFTARTTDNCRVGFIEADRLNEFLRERTDLCMQVVQMMSRELSEINQARDARKSCTKNECALSGSCQSCN